MGTLEMIRREHGCSIWRWRPDDPRARQHYRVGVPLVGIRHELHPTYEGATGQARQIAAALPQRPIRSTE